MTIQIFTRTYRVPETEDAWFMEAGIDGRPIEAVGFQRTVQNWLVIFLSAPGSDVSDLESGGGFLENLGRNQVDYSLNEVSLRARLSAEQTHLEVVQSQQEAGETDPRVLLAESRVLGVSKIADDEVGIDIELVSQAGQTARFNAPILV